MENLKQRVLLVEDDHVNQFVASTLLGKLGLDVKIANNGAEALSLIANKEFQLVLMDIQMPVMDGFEATRGIRSLDDPYFKVVPIIAFTASGMIEIKGQAIECGMNDFLTKPLEMEKMRSKIKLYLSPPSFSLGICASPSIYIPSLTQNSNRGL